MLRWLCFLLLFMTTATSSVAAKVVMIANEENSEDVIDHSEVERIYLGKMTHWSDDSAIVPVMLKNGDLHEAFLDEYLDRTAHRFVSYWRQMVFTGKGMPPKSFAGPAELVTFVASHPGAIGYVSADTPLAAVKILTIR